MKKFKAAIEIIGVNPFVQLPGPILEELFGKAGKDKGFIPVCGTVNGKKFTQTLLKFKGLWRLYINTSMLPKSPKRIGEIIEITIDIDTNDRAITPHPKLVKALEENTAAKKTFERLTPSRQKEIIRYISSLKTEESIERNIEKALGFLTGKNRFVGRDKP